MATYLEIKQLIAEVFSIHEIDESCDLILFEAPDPQNNVVLQNEKLLQSYNKLIYKLGTASFEYCVFLLKVIADYQKEIGRRVADI